MKEVTAKANDCLISIALENGLPIEDVQNENQELIDLRGLPNCLLKGDKVLLPKIQNSNTLKVNQHHVLTLTSDKYLLPIRIVDSELNPLSDIPVKLAHLEASVALTENTDSEGIARFTLPISCSKGLISYEVNEQTIIRPFYCGSLAPANLEYGTQQRLKNLYPNAEIKLTAKQSNSEQLLASIAEEFDTTIDDIRTTLEGEC